MTTSVEPSASAEPGLLGPRVTGRLLDRLAARAVTAGPREQVPIEMPATGKILGHVPHGTPDDVAAAADIARQAQPGWARMHVTDRSKVLLRFAERLLDRQDEVLDLIQLENGKARRHAFEEIIDVAQVSRYYARTAARCLHPHRRAGALPALTQTWECHRPKGVVGVIAPWNYPLTLGISDALPALVAGNAVIVKPDGQTPYTVLRAAELLEEAGLPPVSCRSVTGPGPELGPLLIEHSDFLMFTGSTRTGRIVAAQAAARLIDYSMELGGKNAILVLADADLARAVPGAVRAAFSSTGQLCISGERMYIDAAVWDGFVPRFAKATRSLRLGHSLSYKADIGSLISARQLNTVAQHVDDAVSKGATVLAGGRARPDVGPYFYEPTVLTDTSPGMALYADETFGARHLPVPRQQPGRGRRAGQRQLLRPELLGLDPRRPPGPPGRRPAGGRIRQCQRGLRGHLGVRRRAHGRLEGLGRWQQARRAWHPQVHQCPDHLGSAAHAHRAAGRDAAGPCTPGP